MGVFCFRIISSALFLWLKSLDIDSLLYDRLSIILGFLSTTSHSPLVPSIHLHNMPSDEYKTAIGGGLKLKGSKPSGVTKSKKKKKSKKPEEAESSKLQDALAEEDQMVLEGDQEAVEAGKKVY